MFLLIISNTLEREKYCIQIAALSIMSYIFLKERYLNFLPRSTSVCAFHLKNYPYVF